MLTLKEKYQKITHKKAITDMIAFKLTGCESGVYLRRTITDDKINPIYEEFINKVFDKQLKWQELEQKHYEKLIK